jgi:HlyD family secretion protein
MNPKIRRIVPVVGLILLVVLAALWFLWGRGNGQPSGLISASGTVETVEVTIAPELSGRVADVLVAKGDSVRAGQPLFRQDDTLLQAQRKQAQASVETAKASKATAQGALDTATAQYRQVLEAARLADAPNRTRSWTQSQPWEFDQPDWYYGRAEQIAAMQTEADAAEAALQASESALRKLLAKPEFAGIRKAEERMAQARAAFLVAQDSFDRTDAALSNEDLRQSAQDRLDASKTELEDAQAAYDDLAKEGQADDLRKARADIRAAEDRLNAALDRLARLHTGEFAPSVQVAAAAVKQAEDASAQGDAVLAQAQAQLDLLDVQIAKLTVYAPSDGVVLERNVEPGEMALAGSSALIIGRLDHLTITVYIPEDLYGKIRLGQSASIAVDSYPGTAFSGQVTRIADRAEFTPRNVQTEEGRRTTVFAVEISIDNPDGSLKPGMPADVTFIN